MIIYEATNFPMNNSPPCLYSIDGSAEQSNGKLFVYGLECGVNGNGSETQTRSQIQIIIGISVLVECVSVRCTMLIVRSLPHRLLLFSLLLLYSIWFTMYPIGWGRRQNTFGEYALPACNPTHISDADT